jgi:hypothetical protein
MNTVKLVRELASTITADAIKRAGRNAPVLIAEQITDATRQEGEYTNESKEARDFNVVVLIESLRQFFQYTTFPAEQIH